MAATKASPASAAPEASTVNQRACRHDLGGVMDAGELILKPIVQEAGRRAFQPSFTATQILAGTLGTSAELTSGLQSPATIIIGRVVSLASR